MHGGHFPLAGARWESLGEVLKDEGQRGCSQRQPEALAVVLRAPIARLDQLHGLIAVLCCHGWYRAGRTASTKRVSSSR